MAETASDCWYQDGLHFECTRCGDCCTGAPGYVWVGVEEVQALAEHVGLPALDFRRRFVRWTPGGDSLAELANGDCVFWSAQTGCTVYPVRPRQCRSFPFWRKHLRSRESWRAVVRACPGAGSGPLLSCAEIDRIRAANGDF